MRRHLDGFCRFKWRQMAQRERHGWPTYCIVDCWRHERVKQGTQADDVDDVSDHVTGWWVVESRVVSYIARRLDITIIKIYITRLYTCGPVSRATARYVSRNEIPRQEISPPKITTLEKIWKLALDSTSDTNRPTREAWSWPKQTHKVGDF